MCKSENGTRAGFAKAIPPTLSFLLNGWHMSDSVRQSRRNQGYTITFMSYTVSDKQHLYTIFIINDICNVYICPWLNRLWLCSNWKLIFFSAAAAKIRFSYDGLNFVESYFSLLVFFHLSFLCWTSWCRLSLPKKLRRFWLPKVLRDTWKVISITINEMLFML